MAQKEASVHLVDDDAAILKSLGRLLEASGYRVEQHASAEDFLSAIDPDEPGCVVLDLRMPGTDGHGVQSRLSEACPRLPVIFLTGQGDITASVRAMKGGAVDFLTKPVRAEVILGAVERAIALDAETRLQRTEHALVAERIASLTGREREVLDAVVVGRLNKQIAHDMGIAEKTVKVHRARMMRKLGVTTIAELVSTIVAHNMRG